MRAHNYVEHRPKWTLKQGRDELIVRARRTKNHGRELCLVFTDEYEIRERGDLPAGCKIIETMVGGDGPKPPPSVTYKKRRRV